MITKTCLFCQKIFYVRDYRKDIAKCCSRKCLWHITKKDREPKRLKTITGKKAANSANLKINCYLCKKSFFISPSRIHTKKFCSQKCYTESQTSPAPLKKYLRIYVNGIRKHVHRHIMETFLGRKLNSREHVHHKNHDRHDNRIENLEVLDICEHTRLHWREKSKDK